ncbi:MAG: DUF5996 family protein [Jatrophihabitantaceae bacterium]
MPLAEWRQTRDTVQLWTQILGKVRMANTAVLNHWWNVPLYVSATGLTTSLIPHPSGKSFQADLDFHAHRLEIVTSAGRRRSIALGPGPIAAFYAGVMRHLDELGVGTSIWPMPVEIDGALRMDIDTAYRSYDPDQAHRFWQALVRIAGVFEQFRAGFVGKSSPVHLFWGALDLATTRFSGRPAPAHPGGAPHCGPHVMLEAYSHEVSSLGYWPGGAAEGIFYSYAYPQPEGYRDTPVRPPAASWNDDLAEFVLPYEHVRSAADPERMLLEFAQTTYEAAADAAGWNRTSLERTPPRQGPA